MDVTAPANNDDEAMLADLKLGVSVPVSLAAGVLPTETATVSEPVVPKLEAPVDHVDFSPPAPGVNPQALCALEMLLGMCRVDVHF